MAADLLGSFRGELAKAADQDEVVREQQAAALREAMAEAASDPNTIVMSIFDPVAAEAAPSIVEVFSDLWARYQAAAIGVPTLATSKTGEGLASAVRQTRTGVSFAPYGLPRYSEASTGAAHLEGFFSYYDRLLDPEFLPAWKMSADQATATAMYLRRLRDIAVELAYKALCPDAKSEADYLVPLARTVGPGGGPPVLVTLNFDVALEQTLAATGLAYDDGFGPAEPGHGPLAGEGPNPGKLWSRAARNMDVYRGFSDERDVLRLLKLHGSLGWYVLEQGDGDIGWPPLLRRNVSYQAFRLRPELLWEPGCSDRARGLASGGPGDLALAGPGEEVTRKAGAIWLRPLLEYAKSTKTHPNVLSTGLMHEFLALTKRARTIIVVGYSWGDVHINDAVFEAIARGASLVNLGYDPRPDGLLALLTQKFPTTSRSVLERSYAFGGGAKAILGDHRPTLPDGTTTELDILTELNNLPAQALLTNLE